MRRIRLSTLVVWALVAYYCISLFRYALENPQLTQTEVLLRSWEALTWK